MEDTANKETPQKAKTKGRLKGCLKGCLITCLVIVAVFVYTFWQMGVTSRHARHIHEAIQKGMSLDQLENLLAASNDRHLLWFQILADGKWDMVPRDQFIQAVSIPTDSATTHARVELTFMGSTPFRVSFFVEFDSAGRVSQVTKSFGWD
jgi:hypothetical protein